MGTFTNLFGFYPRVAILEVLTENEDTSLSAPEIMEMTGVSRGAVYYSLPKLVEDGLVVKDEESRRPKKFILNHNDVRAMILPYLDHILTIGQIEASLKEDKNIPQKELLPSSILTSKLYRKPERAANDSVGESPYPKPSYSWEAASPNSDWGLSGTSATSATGTMNNLGALTA
jgi:DNA-binding transcriptional ArsR family regulator